MPADVVARILNRTTRDPKTGCWEYNGCRVADAEYGQISYRGRSCRVHRVVYELFCGDPAGLMVLHGCDNPRCIKPAHMTLGTHADNVRDRTARGRNRVARQKLSPESRARVLELAGRNMPRADIAREVGVSWRHVYRILRAARDANRSTPV